MLDPRTVSNPYVRTLLGVLDVQGVDVRAIVAALHLDTAALDDPNGRIAPEIVQRIWQHGLALTGDPLLGLKVAAAARPSTFRALGLAAMTSASLHAALSLMLRYYRLVSESGALTAQPQADGDIAIVYTEQLRRVRLLPQQVEAIVGGILVMARGLSERSLMPTAVAFRHAPLGDGKTYRHFFGCEVQFNAPAHALRLPAAELTRRLPQADADLHRIHCELLDRQLAGLPQAGSVTAFAKQWLAARTSGAMRIDDLAQALGMSVRALQRALQQEGQPWTALVDNARRDALETLLRAGVSLDEAARQMGYHDASSLSRASRRWFGKTAGEWRRVVDR
ncbi:AraC family transcriptional regulator ligand-binding domain-containing protein [Tahibacter sp.]|uniref:AraC family transcriptional regulator n=1 Tax=Tahibacter sp. TaxID=2056211 RepID=UPI0028C50235|nr:AraC family transcriptional regulator ligand-binding domain-containing protein [Tahibacter sp.]